jgi:hypothetical protein
VNLFREEEHNPFAVIENQRPVRREKIVPFGVIHDLATLGRMVDEIL